MRVGEMRTGALGRVVAHGGFAVEWVALVLFVVFGALHRLLSVEVPPEPPLEGESCEQSRG